MRRTWTRATPDCGLISRAGFPACPELEAAAANASDRAQGRTRPPPHCRDGARCSRRRLHSGGGQENGQGAQSRSPEPRRGSARRSDSCPATDPMRASRTPGGSGRTGYRALQIQRPKRTWIHSPAKPALEPHRPAAARARSGPPLIRPGVAGDRQRDRNPRRGQSAESGNCAQTWRKPRAISCSCDRSNSSACLRSASRTTPLRQRATGQSISTDPGGSRRAVAVAEAARPVQAGPVAFRTGPPASKPGSSKGTRVQMRQRIDPDQIPRHVRRHDAGSDGELRQV